MAARQLDPRLAETLKRYGATKEDLWDCHGTWVVYHAALERVAATAGIVFDPPQVLEADGDKRCVALCVSAEMAGKREWSIGEASPHNYIVKGKMQAYPYAMAEKRGKDRVILKLIGLAGQVYSEEEADDFKARGREPAAEAPQASQVEDLTQRKNPPGVTKVRAWVTEHVRALHGCESPNQFMETVEAERDRWIKTRAMYPNLWEGPDGSGLRGEALKQATAYGCRPSFDHFLKEVEAGAADFNQQQAAQ